MAECFFFVSDSSHMNAFFKLGDTSCPFPESIESAVVSYLKFPYIYIYKTSAIFSINSLRNHTFQHATSESDLCQIQSSSFFEKTLGIFEY